VWKADFSESFEKAQFITKAFYSLFQVKKLTKGICLDGKRDYVGDSQLTDAGFNEMKKGLRKMKSLQHLSLNFNETVRDYFARTISVSERTDAQVHRLKEGLKYLSSLKYLSLNFYGQVN